MLRSGTSLVCLVGFLLIAPALVAFGAFRPWSWRGAAAQVNDAKKIMFEDSREAETLLRQAAQTGYPEAEGLLGNMLLSRCRTDADVRVEVKVEALKWITLGAKHNDKRAQADLASVCLEGRYVQKNYVQAWTWGELASMAAQPDISQTGRSIRDAAARSMSAEDLALARRKAAAFSFNLDKNDYTAPLRRISPLYAVFVLVGLLGTWLFARITWRSIQSRPRRANRVVDMEPTVAEERFYRVLKQALPLNIILALQFPLHEVVQPKGKLRRLLWRIGFRKAAKGKYVRCALRDVETLRVLAAIEVHDSEFPTPPRDRFVETVLRYNQIPIVVVAAQASYSVQEITRQLEDLLGCTIPSPQPTPQSGLKMAKAAVG